MDDEFPIPNVHRLESELLILWRRLLKSDTLSIDDDFFVSGGDSLLAVDMLLKMEKVLDCRLPEKILIGAETIRQLAPRIAEAARLPASPCAHFNADGDTPPLFFFHGDLSTGGLRARRLITLLAQNHPLAVIEPHGSRGGTIPHSIEQMASDRLPLIMERQAQGPYRLAGFCNGALVAFEVAHLLDKAGQKVEFVALIDPPVSSARPTMRALLRLAKHTPLSCHLASLYETMNRYESFRKKSLRKKLAVIWSAMTRSYGPDAWWRVNKIFAAYTAAMAHYLPATLAVPVIFYAANFDGEAWRYLSPDLEVVELDGEHELCMASSAEILSEHLRQRMTASYSNRS